MKQDLIYMARALQLARQGLYTTDPNPRVGCVLVKDGEIIGEGWHQRAGLSHAEVEALNNAPDAQGATAYVTLEPCSHFGRTPPCCDALINAGISRVVVAMQDPNPLVAGQGLQRLRAAGIDVVCGVLEQDAQLLNQGFIKRMTQQRPWVRSKLAMSLDGRTAMASGESKWITSAQARADVQRLRAESSAILTGINTVLADDPALTARVDEDVVQPLRVVLDSRLAMPVDAQLVNVPGRTLILTSSTDDDKKQALQQAGFEIYVIPEHQGRLDLRQVMTFLAEQQINEVLVEAGPTLNGALLAENLVDEWVIYMAPCVLGDQGRGLFTLPNMNTMADKKNLNLADVRQVGPDLKLTFTAN
ncbi:MAG: bifunctional diaminohydroxyphosphoribosylaminopyrimidine deaminase/5-amino-6-(5-phosphoribosylamino)uracil reductase RibD [Methylococcaceae bacterium]|nr:bifunctional diaminohydroxyphosphoribosylaminopyrimidine deaminase/5-amino-6-(5-phosphoribosylamino)uracil reductase RibD [Methylococcaceae bacterium]MDP2391810.1 bifunctional diaminohydroxyphosphoribosylaminopyrimidine deaminase/5-amino-6-(5-phosphoribosylamino)uracil reductase RibD [Methylococcaceae bacterium]MDP3018951.1 bifunctional diaminohydroxyphosphoribosylaminopyrimidine deaminase/5-amino-6-(5-phosphoribosylamino)uracil reductase RibD [Methylococcaceae bacterium]MDP3391512.1 bifuncti